MDTKTIQEDIKEKLELGFPEELIHKLTGYKLEEIRRIKEKMQ